MIQNSLVSQLFWREFYFYVVYYFPYVLKGKNYNPKYNGIKWTTKMANFKKWCNNEILDYYPEEYINDIVDNVEEFKKTCERII